MFRLGMFDPMDDQPYLDLGPEDVDNSDARALALQTAQESIVLLKNAGGFLPLTNVGQTRFAFIGPHANATQDMLSAPQYHGTNRLVNSHSPLLVARARGWNVTYARGCNICDIVPAGYPNMPCHGPVPPAPNTSMIPAAVAAARAADVAILFLGADQTTEAENFDRRTLTLVGAQQQLLEAVLAVQDKVVLVLINGGPIDVSSAVANPAARAVVEAFQPGELGGDAIVDVLSGAVSPSGRMPYTTYFANFTARDIRDVDLRSGSGITYQWFRDPVVFPFGFGLSYTSFRFQWSDNPAAAAPKALQLPTSAEGVSAFSIQHTVTVTNTGDRASDVVVLAFAVATAGSPDDMPLRRLFGFERVTMLQPGANATVTFASDASALSIVPRDGTTASRLFPGVVRVECGGAPTYIARDYDLVGPPVTVEDNAWLSSLRR